MASHFSIENHGSIILVRPLTAAAKAWLKETAPDDAQFLGNAMAVEPRCLDGVLDAIADAGMDDDED